MPRFILAAPNGLQQALRLTLLSASMMTVPFFAFAQDSGQESINFTMPSSGAAAVAPQNPYDYGQEGAIPGDAAAVENKQKHWTQMNYTELQAELARTDTNYSLKLRGEMEARLKSLEDAALGGTGVSATGEVPPVVAGTPQSPTAAAKTEAAAPAVVVVPADATPWWKKPKSEQAAAKAAARARDNAVAPQVEQKELSAREKIYQKIQNNRGGQ